MRRLISLAANRRSLLDLLRVLWRYRELALEMTRRDLFDRHTGSVLGPLWVIAQPTLVVLIQTIVFSVIFGLRLSNDGDGGGYVTYLLAGLIPWTAFQEAMGRSPTTILENKSLVRQIVFPTAILPLKTVLATLVPLTIGLMVIVAIDIVHGTARPEWWLLVPLAMVMQVALTLGFAYLISSVTVFIRDMKTIVQFVLMIGLYIHPIIYTPSMLPNWANLALALSPVTHLINVYRDILVFHAVTNPISWGLCPILSLGSMVLGYRVFRSIHHRLSEAL